MPVYAYRLVRDHEISVEVLRRAPVGDDTDYQRPPTAEELTSVGLDAILAEEEWERTLGTGIRVNHIGGARKGKW